MAPNPLPRHRSSLPVSGLLGLAACALLSAPGGARADGFIQTERLHRSKMFTLSWEYSIPTTSLQTNLVQGGNAAGIDVGARFGISRRISLGGAATWNQFTQSKDPAASMNSFSLGMTAHWYFGNQEIQPYVGVLAGGAYLESQQAGGAFLATWAPMAAPEVGFLFTIADGLALILAGRYQMNFVTFYVNGDESLPQVKWPSWASVQLGVGFY